MNKFNTKAMAEAAILLAICIASQFFKNLSVYITGPIVNVCLILCVLMAGLAWSVVLSIITPVTSFLITGNPLMSAVPLIIPCVMVGNIILVVCVGLVRKKIKGQGGKSLAFLGSSMIVGSVLKAAFMGGVIALLILPNMIPAAMADKLPVFQTTFSITQLVTSLIGSALTFIIWLPLKKAIKSES